MTSKDNYILWLPLWYPNRTEPFSGDFIQRHARAVSAFRPIEVLVVIRDLSMRPGTTEEVRSETGGLSETIIYYNTANGPFRFLNRFRSFLKYCRLVKKASDRIFQSKGFPAGLHPHIYGRNCFMARRLSRNLGVPLFFSEQQTGFLKIAPDSFCSWGFFRRFPVKKFLSAVSLSSFVSDYLGVSVRKFYASLPYVVIPNVVDEEFFRPLSGLPDHRKISFIHISTLRYQKNFEDIIRAFQRVLVVFADFELRVFGPVTSEWRMKVKGAGLEGHIFFEGEQPHILILPFLQSADALILYSRFETFGCVLIEALSCGTPVIVSDIEPMRELLREGADSVMVTGEHPEKLAETLVDFVRNPLRPDRVSLHRQTAARFGMKRVGEMFEHLYQQVLK